MAEKWNIELDGLDQSILHSLLSRGDMTVAELTKKLSRPRTTILYRLMKLYDLLKAKVVFWIPHENIRGIEMAIIKIRILNNDEKILEDLRKGAPIREIINLGQRKEYLIKLISTRLEIDAYLESIEWLRAVKKYNIEIVETYPKVTYELKHIRDVNSLTLNLSNYVVTEEKPGIIKKRRVYKS